MNVFAVIGAAWWAIALSIIIGAIAALVVAFVTSDSRGDGWSKVGAVLVFLFVGVSVFGICALTSAYSPVQSGTVELIRRFGGLTDEYLEEGLNWKAPFIETTEVVNIKQQTYEMMHHQDGTAWPENVDWPDYSIDSRTSDGQLVIITATVVFLQPVESTVDIRRNIGDIAAVVDKVVKKNVRSWSRSVARNYSAEALYSGDIINYQNAMCEILEREFESQGYGLVMVSFNVRDIDFTAEYSGSIERQQIALVNVETQAYNAEAAKWEAQQVIEQRYGEAQGNLKIAEAAADAVRIAADAEAYAISEKGAALKRYPEILQLEFVKSLVSGGWGYLPSTSVEWLLPVPEVK
jgi:regulator of protease activity HflC (stomatin/prohibitin superfamily)